MKKLLPCILLSLASLCITVNRSFAAGHTVSVTMTSATCNGGCNGTANATVSGGSGTYSYSWAPSGGTASNAASLCAGSYTVTVTDQADMSTATATVMITQPTQLVTTGSNNKTSCVGVCDGLAGGVTTGGTPPYTYRWSGNTGTSNSDLLFGASYCWEQIPYTVTDANGCTASSTAYVNPPYLMYIQSTVTNVSCNGGADGNIAISVQNGPGNYTYSWSPNVSTGATASNLAAGTYTVYVGYTGSGSNSCVMNQPVTVNQPTAISIATSVTNVSCAGGSNGTISATASGGTPPYTYSWSNGSTSTSIVNLAAGTYTITVTDSKGCSRSAAATVSSPTPVIANAGSDTTICRGVSATLRGSASGGAAPYSYRWSPASGLSASSAATTTASPFNTTVFSLTVTDANGCAATDTVVVNVSTAVNVDVSVTQPTCGLANGSATTQVTSGTPPYTYSWMPAGGNGPNLYNAAPPTYTVTVRDADGCIGFGFVNFQHNPLTVSTSSTSATCNQSDGSASVSESGGTSPYTYTWSTNPVQTTSTATGLPAGNYTVTVTDDIGCTSSATVIISNTNGPTSAITSVVNPSCSDWADGQLGVTASGGTPPYSYQWSNGNSTATTTSLTAGTYSVTVTDNSGCISIASRTLTAPAPLTVSVSATSPTCAGSCDGAAALTVAGGTMPYYYSVSPPSGSGTSNLCPGTYTATVTDAKGCTTSSPPFTINSTPAFTPNAGADKTICSGSPTSVTATGGASYSWSPSASLSCASCASPIATPTVTTTYTLTATSSAGCTGTDEVTISVTNGPVISVAKTDASCNQSNGSATASVTGGIPPYNYTWLPSGGSGATASNLASGTYTVSVTDANNTCTASAITVISNLSSPWVTATSTPTCNAGATGSATVAATGGVPPYTYLWQPGNSTSQTITGLTAGSYSVTVTDNNGCFGTASVSVPVSPQLSVWAISAAANCVNNGSATAWYGGGTPPYTFSWLPGGQTTATATGLSPGSYTVTVTDAAGCSRTGYAWVYNNCRNYITGNIYNDLDGDCQKDAGETVLVGKNVKAMPGNYYGITDNQGNYRIAIPDAGSYTVTYVPQQAYWSVVCPAGGSYSVSFPSVGDTSANNNFALQHDTTAQDIGMWVTNSAGRPGFNITYYVYYYNVGATTVNGNLKFTHDPGLVYVGSSGSASYDPSQHLLEWSIPNITPTNGISSYQGLRTATFYVPVNTVLGTVLQGDLTLEPVTGDYNTSDNIISRPVIVTGSYDPNMKEVTPAGTGTEGFITPEDSMLYYTVHFQNTGTDTAFTVMIKDTISSLLDLETFESGAATHAYTVQLDGNEVTWTFNNILLVDSNRNEPASHGHVQYRIRQKPGNVPGTVISNTADIYFDFNAPVRTNTVINTIADPTGMLSPVSSAQVSVYPNPFDNSATFVIQGMGRNSNCSLSLYDVMGKEVRAENNIANGYYILDRSDLAPGMYFYRITQAGKVLGAGRLIAQ